MLPMALQNNDGQLLSICCHFIEKTKTVSGRLINNENNRQLPLYVQYVHVNVSSCSERSLTYMYLINVIVNI